MGFRSKKSQTLSQRRLAVARRGYCSKAIGRFDVVVRLPDVQRDDIEALGALPIMLPTIEGETARSIPLREVARFAYKEGLNQISRESGKRMVVV